VDRVDAVLFYEACDDLRRVAAEEVQSVSRVLAFRLEPIEALEEELHCMHAEVWIALLSLAVIEDEARDHFFRCLRGRDESCVVLQSQVAAKDEERTLMPSSIVLSLVLSRIVLPCALSWLRLLSFHPVVYEGKIYKSTSGTQDTW